MRVGASKNTDSIFFRKGKLFMHITDFGGDFELKAESPAKFFLTVFPDFLQVEFKTDKQGKPVQTWYIQGNIKHSMKKF